MKKLGVRKAKFWLLPLFLVILAMGYGSYRYKFSKAPTSQKEESLVEKIINDKDVSRFERRLLDTSDWFLYENKVYGFSFKYPKELGFQLGVGGKLSRVSKVPLVALESLGKLVYTSKMTKHLIPVSSKFVVGFGTPPYSRKGPIFPEGELSGYLELYDTLINGGDKNISSRPRYIGDVVWPGFRSERYVERNDTTEEGYDEIIYSYRPQDAKKIVGISFNIIKDISDGEFDLAEMYIDTILSTFKLLEPTEKCLEGYECPGR